MRQSPPHLPALRQALGECDLNHETKIKLPLRTTDGIVTAVAVAVAVARHSYWTGSATEGIFVSRPAMTTSGAETQTPKRYRVNRSADQGSVPPVQGLPGPIIGHNYDRSV